MTSVSSIIARFEALSGDLPGELAGPLLDWVRIEPGSIADYRALESFHYRSANPGIVTSVLRAALDQPTVVGRYLQRRSEPRVVGVLVRALPRLACRMRDDAVGQRYRALKPGEAAMLINREIRTISRVIIDPRFRGCGLAVRLVRAALAHPELHDASLRFTEALAAMGRLCPFFERAGMTRYERPPRAEHLRLSDALESIGIGARTFASFHELQARLAALAAPQRNWLMREVRRWHRDAFRESLHTVDLQEPELLRRIQAELSKRIVYYIHLHPAAQTDSTSKEDSCRT